MREINFSNITQQIFPIAVGYAFKTHADVLQTDHIIYAILGRPDLFPGACAEMVSLTLHAALFATDIQLEQYGSVVKDIAWSEELQNSISIANKLALFIGLRELTPELLIYGIFANKDSIGHKLYLNAHYNSELEFDKFIKYMLKRLVFRHSGNYDIEDNDEVNFLLDRANILYQAENYEEAIDVYDAVLVISPSDPDALLLKGNSLFRLNRHSEAIDTFNILLQLEPGNFIYSHEIARSLCEMDKWEDALTILEKFDHYIFMNIDQKKTFLLSKCRTLIAVGKNSESLTYTNELLAIEPDNISALYNKGAALNHLGSYGEAITLFDKVLHVDPCYTNALLEKINALESLKIPQKALELCDYVLALDPGNISAQKKKARLLKNSKRKWWKFRI